MILNFIGAIYGYVFARSRAQFHPAGWALVYALLLGVLMAAALYVMSWCLALFGESGYELDYQTNLVVFGPVLCGELVRGHVRMWLGYQPTEWCFPAIGGAGFTVGAIFGLAMALRWGEWPSLEPLAWAVGGLAFYLLLGWLMRLEEKHRPALAA